MNRDQVSVDSPLHKFQQAERDRQSALSCVTVEHSGASLRLAPERSGLTLSCTARDGDSVFISIDGARWLRDQLARILGKDA